MDTRVDDAVDQAGRQRYQRRQQPQPPPQRAVLAADHLVAAEAAEAVEGPSHASTVTALMQLEAAVAGTSLLRVVDQHGRLITPRTKAWRNQRQRWQFHWIKPTPGSPRPRSCF